MARATLNGVLSNDGGLPCEGRFDWGMTTAYGMQTAWQPVTVGVEFSETIRGLSHSQTYHYRAVARNRLGVVFGADKTFTTLGELGLPTFISEKDMLSLIGAT